jgi:hypothetical protein
MSEKALGTRIKRIENAAGQHCIVKMAVFKSCLQDSELWELSELAGEALERLKAGAFDGGDDKKNNKSKGKGKKK